MTLPSYVRTSPALNDPSAAARWTVPPVNGPGWAAVETVRPTGAVAHVRPAGSSASTRTFFAARSAVTVKRIAAVSPTAGARSSEASTEKQARSSLSSDWCGFGFSAHPAGAPDAWPSPGACLA